MKSKDKDDDARLRVPRDVFKRIQHAAVDAGVSTREWVLDVVRAALSEKGEAK